MEQIVSNLIENNFLNEERFAKAYARGKFKQKGWGRVKIKQGLKLKKIPDKLINKALQEIDGDEYMNTLSRIIQKKDAVLIEKDPYKRRYKLQQFAMGRGYEGDLIAEVVSEQTAGNK